MTRWHGSLGTPTSSYANQEGKSVILPYPIVEVPLGFQPMGVAARGNTFAVAAYFEPAICIVEVEEQEGDESLVLTPSWIRGIKDESKNLVRMFPDVLGSAGANRMQTVNFGGEEELWISRNGDNVFFVLQRVDDDWHLVQRLALPNDGRVVHSAFLDGNTLFTIESVRQLDQLWSIFQYEMFDPPLLMQKVADISPWTYGMWRLGDELFMITDFRSSEELGVYIMRPDDDNPSLEKDQSPAGLWGNGFCALENFGIGIISQYGQAHSSPFSQPGKLLIVRT